MSEEDRNDKASPNDEIKKLKEMVSELKSTKEKEGEHHAAKVAASLNSSLCLKIYSLFILLQNDFLHFMQTTKHRESKWTKYSRPDSTNDA